MAGAGIFRALYDEAEFNKILEALEKASNPNKEAIAWFMGEELQYISTKAFEREADPVTGKKWDPIKPRGFGAKSEGSTTTILRDYDILFGSLTHNDSPEGTVFGSNMVYARIHQQGGQAGRDRKTLIPARPYMGVPQDFDRRILNDPAILELLGI